MKREISLDSDGPAIQVRTKMWFEIDGHRLIGEGRADLLRQIQETGSINAAAIKMDISFRKAWSMLKDMEEVLGQLLVNRSRGGLKGGTASLTPIAFDLLAKFDEAFQEFHQ